MIYRAAEPVAIVDLVTPAAPVAPGADYSVRFGMVNVTDDRVEVTTRLSLLDADGLTVAEGEGGPHSVGPGLTIAGEVSCRAPDLEGSYSSLLEVELGAETVARARGLAEIVAGRIVRFEAPEELIPGRSIEVLVSYEDRSASATSVEIEVAALDRSGRPDGVIGAANRSIGPSGQATAVFEWAGRDVALGLCQLRATATTDRGHRHEAARWILVHDGPDPIRRPTGRVP